MSKNSSNQPNETPAKTISREVLKNKIYTIRGQKVMLDADLAEIYGYETKAFNRQVKNNIAKFEGEDFMFQLTQNELDELLRCNFYTSNKKEEDSPRCQNGTTNNRGTSSLRCQNGTSKTDRRGGNRYLPYAFTEQGIYMLMTVLRGELATRQSRALIRLFKAMKDYVLENKVMLEYKNNLEIALQVMEHTQDIANTKITLNHLDAKIHNINAEIGIINQQLSNTVSRSEISPIILDFTKITEQHEYILSNGQPARASEVYINLYARAKQSIYIIDNYISIKTLRHLQKTKPNIEVTIFSDNLGNYLHKADYLDFQKEYPHIKIQFVHTSGQIHDRFIILDYDTKEEIAYHCGSSAKDAGYKMTALSKFANDKLTRNVLHTIIDKLKTGKKLILK